MKTIALVMIVKNEERHLKRCLDSVKNLVNRMIVVDTGSNDHTVGIARDAGAEVYGYIWKNDFADARNYALSFSDADLNLILDADEYISSGTREDIESVLESGDCLGDIYIRNVFMQDGERAYFKFRASRVIPKGVRYVGRIHEQPDSALPCVLIPVLAEHDGYLMPGVKEKRNLPYLLREAYEHPDDSYFLYKAACSYQNIGEEEKAFVLFQELYNRMPPEDPHWARAAYILGRQHELDRDMEKAEKHYREALERGYEKAWERLTLLRA